MQVEALSAVVSTVADSVRADAIVDVGAGQVELHFLLITVLLVKLPKLGFLGTLSGHCMVEISSFEFRAGRSFFIGYIRINSISQDNGCLFILLQIRVYENDF